MIDSVARSLSMLLAVPDRAYSCLIAADYVLFCLVLLSKCVSAVVRLLAGSRCLVNCIAHPGSVVSAHESRPCSSRLHRSSALLIVYLHACCAQVTAIHAYDPWPYNWLMACARCICLLTLCMRACSCCRTDTDADTVPHAAAPLRPAPQTEAHSAWFGAGVSVCTCACVVHVY